MLGPDFSNEAYYERFNESSFIASTGVKKAVFTELCKLADIGKPYSPFQLK